MALNCSNGCRQASQKRIDLHAVDPNSDRSVVSVEPQYGHATASGALRALQSLVAHVRLNQPLEDLDGLDTDEDLAEETLEEAAGKVMAEEIAGPLGLRTVK